MISNITARAESINVPGAKGVRRVRNLMIPMRDGVRLAADLFIPEDANHEAKFPVVMEYTPYRKDETNLLARGHYLHLPRHGYILARVDVRGTGASEGVNTGEYVLQEQDDGYDAIEWMARQPWCDGHINMLGISYGGFTALQVATHNPPHLTSIIPVDFTDDRYTDDCHYRGGLLRKYYDIGYYGGFMIVWNAMPPPPVSSGADWAKIWEQHLVHNEPYLLEWYKHQTNGSYWRQGSVRDIPDRIKCPVFMIGGWRDGYPNSPLRLYEMLQVPRKVLIGPWNHAMPDTAIPGPRIDYLYEVVRWLDYWCKGKDTGIMDEPPVVVYMQHYQPPMIDRLDTKGQWRAEMDWPPADAGEKIVYLGKNHVLEDNVKTTGHDVFEYNPTVGVASGLFSGGMSFDLPGDQRTDESFSQVYTTSPLVEDVYILGWPHAVLYVSSSARVIGFGVSLNDVAPDGVSHLVAKGVLNATRRESFIDPKPLTPGEVYELNIQIDCTAWKFAKGHRIRLGIASADWPNLWPTPELATNHVFWGTKKPSRLILPTVPAQGTTKSPTFHPSKARLSDAVYPPNWQITRDAMTGQTTVSLCVDSSFRVDNSTVIERQSSGRYQVNPSDPAHASARGQHINRIVHSNNLIEGRANIAIQATATHFQIIIGLEIRINDAPYFTKHWTESVPRQLL